MGNTNELPIYDVDADERLSEKRKEACKIDYLDMQLHHIDKIFASAYKYDKSTGEPTHKKPRSINELVFNLLKCCQALTVEIDDLKKQVHDLRSTKSAA